MIESDDGSVTGSSSGSDAEEHSDNSIEASNEWSVVTRKKNLKKTIDRTGNQVVTPILVRTRPRMNLNVQGTGTNQNIQNSQRQDEETTNQGETNDDMEVDPNVQPQGVLNPGPPLLDPEVLTGRTIFVTPKPQGMMKDVIVIECSDINGRPFTGTITYTEAREKIFIESLGLPTTLLHSYKFSFNKCRSISYKLNEQVDLEILADKVYFSFERNYLLND